MLVLYLRYDRVIEVAFHNLETVWKLTFSILLPLGLFLVAPKSDEAVSSATGVVFGAWIGIILERMWVRYSVSPSIWKRVISFILGMTGVLLLRIGLKELFDGLQPDMLFRFIRYGFIGVWFTLGAPFIFIALKLADSSHQVQTN
jgi:hypothetical protein